MSAYAINCPNCAGSLDALGGGRQVVSLTCKYCGSVLDVEDEYKVLAQFKKVDIPSSPFRIGMQGKIKGIDFTIIGMVAYSCVKGVSVGEDTWIDFMLFSPTHGYAWLSYEEGTVIFSRRTRSLPSSNFMGLSPKNRVDFEGKTYKFYEAYRAYVSYVQGELTWVARKHDLVHIFEAIRPPFGVTLEHSKNEDEYSISEYLKAEDIYESFGLTQKTSESFHALKPFSAPKSKSLAFASALFIGVSLFMIIFVLLFNSGTFIKEDNFSSRSRQIPFHIDNPEHLVELDIRSNVNNSWIYYDISVIDKQNEEIYALGKEISYYHGYEGGESWSEGSREASAYFKVPKSGDYLLLFNAPENRVGVPTRISIKENVIRSYYFIGLFFFFIFTASIYLFKRIAYESRLWKHTQEDDDD
ncbi:MAG: DUF4178 domain-containing protein [Campylobacterota bacterium]|nr:DUF4178 domain-containing protein [Campylobacterota bacterium]